MLYLICDDNEKAALSLSQKIHALEPDSETRTFSSAEALLFAAEDCIKTPDGVFMDIRLKGENGISAAKHLFKLYPSLGLVYVTGYAQEYLQELYMAPLNKHPIAVLTKPIDLKYLKNALDKIRDKTAVSECISIKVGGEIVYINTDDIISVSSRSRKLYIECRNGSGYEFYGRLSEFIKSLPDYFCQCHKSYIVNLKLIAKIKNWNSILMINNSEYPVSRTYRTQFKETAVLFES